jgi:glycosyltransferase involved in cell wall biosynthesis
VTIVVMHGFAMSGIARAVFSLAGHLAARHDVQIVSITGRRGGPFFSVPGSVRLTALDGPARGRASTTRRVARKLVSCVGSVLIHPNDVAIAGMSLWTDLLLLRTLRSIRTGIVITTRPSLNIVGSLISRPGVVVIGQEHMFLAHRPRELQTDVSRRCGDLDAMVVLTQADRQHHREVLPAGARVECIPNAVPPLGGPRADPSSTIVLAAGRLTWQKGFERLVRAFADVARAEPGWTARIYGRGPRYDKVQERIHACGVSDRMELADAVADLGKEMERASIFVMSSRYEGFPIVLIEAMSKGLSVVAFDCPTGPADIIEDGDTGILVPDGDVTALGAAILDLIRDEPKRRRLGAAAAERVRRWDVATIGARWDRLLAELTDSQEVRR